jgi:hypothetical protein
MLDKGLEILRKEVNNLFMESSQGKLSPVSARDLVGYVKLLHELEERQKASALDAAKLAKAAADHFVR